MSTVNIQPDSQSSIYPVALNRVDDDGLIILTCEDIPELFVAVRADEEIRPALDRVLKVAFGEKGGKPQVYTNGSVEGPTIDTLVRIV